MSSVALADRSILTEPLVTLAEAATPLPAYRGTGRARPETLVRWGTKGIRLPDGTIIKLELARAGGRFLTSHAAVARFIAAQTAAALPETAAIPARSPARRQKASAEAGRRLAGMKP